MNSIEFTVKRFAGIFVRRRRGTRTHEQHFLRKVTFYIFEKYNRKPCLRYIRTSTTGICVTEPFDVGRCRDGSCLRTDKGREPLASLATGAMGNGRESPLCGPGVFNGPAEFLINRN